MAALTVSSKIRMNSGYEIPRLGYGVCIFFLWSLGLKC